MVTGAITSPGRSRRFLAVQRRITRRVTALRVLQRTRGAWGSGLSASGPKAKRIQRLPVVQGRAAYPWRSCRAIARLQRHEGMAPKPSMRCAPSVRPDASRMCATGRAAPRGARRHIQHNWSNFRHTHTREVIHGHASHDRDCHQSSCRRRNRRSGFGSKERERAQGKSQFG